MYKEILPEGCPSVKAIEDEKILYRICVHETNVGENYHPYTKLYPHEEKYKAMCDAYSISLFDKKETATLYAKRNARLGTHIAEIAVKRTHGKLRLTNKKTGHYSLWLYETFNHESIDCQIEAIHAD